MSEPEKTTNVIQRYAQPIGLTLTKGARGAYRWTLDVKAEGPDEALRIVKALDLELNRSFGEVRPAEQHAVKPEPTEPLDPHVKMDQHLKRIRSHVDHWNPEGEKGREA